ncbi:MAG TPA: hypothetical protein VMG98_12315 [Verrucomicrobiae bacterium]|nr:hypothetical protein [Verrucomicrobiae bacterium]
MRQIQFAFVTLVILAFVACSGTQTEYVSPTAGPTAAASSTVSFLVIVPPAGSARTRPNVVVPSNATSVKFTIESVNGTAYTGTATTETLASSNSSCQVVSGQLSCAFNLSAPVGTLIYTVTVYNGTSVIAEGNVSLTTTAGSTVSAPVTLSGTVTKIVLSVESGVEGVSATYPVTVQAEDSNGNTILGTYTSPITLTDTDASGSTSVATSGSDNPHAGELISSSDVATLSYNGGTMSAAATIGASASGVNASNVTSASFLPTANYLAQSGSITLGYTSYGTYNYDTPATAQPSPSWNTYTSSPIPIATGQTFDGVSNAIAATGLGYTDAISIASYLSPASTSYFVWSGSNGAATLGPLGFTDPNNGFYEYLFDTSGTVQQTCAAPYAQLLVIPMPSSWNVMSGSGLCTTVFNDGEGDTDTYAYASNGSYTDSTSESGYEWPPGEASTAVDSAGDATYSMDNEFGQGTLAVPAPSPGASVIPVTWTFPGSAPIVPTPAPTSVPNPWAAIGLANGTIPNPLLQDTMAYKGAIASLPAMCAVPPGLVPATNPPLSEADESVTAADPMNSFLPLYVTETIKHYYLNGVGEVCNENQTLADYFDGDTYYYYWFTSYNYQLGGAIAWYAGTDENYDSDFDDTYTYITTTSLTAANARVRDFTKAAPAAAQALTAMTYNLAHGHGLSRRLMRARPTSRYVRP